MRTLISLVVIPPFLLQSSGFVASGFATSPATSHKTKRPSTSRVVAPSSSMVQGEDEGEPNQTRRRSLLTGAALAASSSLLLSFPVVCAADTGAQVRGIDVTPFNGLMFQYRGNDFAGLKASDLNEPSISYQEFVEKLKAGQVEFVEFLAPDGDEAYATLKTAPGQAATKQPPIRIGEGYPIEQHDGYSSPAFAVRTVKNAGVPYRFTVPALTKLSERSS
jgi:hypothetical protein